MPGSYTFKIGETVEVDVGTEQCYMGAVQHVYPDATLDIGHGLCFMAKTARKVPVDRVSRWPAESNNREPRVDDVRRIAEGQQDELIDDFFDVPLWDPPRRIPKAPKKTRRQLTQRQVQNKLDTWERTAVRHQERARDAERRKKVLKGKLDEAGAEVDEYKVQVEELTARHNELKNDFEAVRAEVIFLRKLSADLVFDDAVRQAEQSCFKRGDRVEVNFGLEDYYVGQVHGVNPKGTLNIEHGPCYCNNRVEQGPCFCNKNDINPHGGPCFCNLDKEVPVDRVRPFVEETNESKDNEPEDSNDPEDSNEPEESNESNESNEPEGFNEFNESNDCRENAEVGEIGLELSPERAKQRLDFMEKVVRREQERALEAERETENIDAFRVLSLRVTWKKVHQANARAGRERVRAERAERKVAELKEQIVNLEELLARPDEIEEPDNQVDVDESEEAEHEADVVCADTFQRLLDFFKF